MKPEITLGSVYLGGGRCGFRVWAPQVRRVEVRIVSPDSRTALLEQKEGYYEVILERGGNETSLG